ncbi:hypothetical protein [Rathayibacter sp. VKM Ac-2630]|uniref:hypothetical protein n=1 Tax=Rathayibacter sp. VKM Ac-2630 TaxID=1938617 RepID=UPI000980E049|nr:hypothetical protein [Rathayibacter sp. VKM Ac-2630]OOB90332.1 hypothetical protein B0T42_12605 [Rathayibacter sp. VKM Ac-2630]
MTDALLHQFTSHIAGKNAKVNIYADRIEWEKPRGLSGAKLTAGVVTMGMSLAATGVGKKGSASTEMIPLRSVTSVTTKRDGFLNSIVSVLTGGNSIDFRVSHKEAEEVRGILNRLLLAL